MLFLTPPKIENESPIPSPLIEIVEGLSNMRIEEESQNEIIISNELLKLLDGTPSQQKEMLQIKQFDPK